MVTHGIIDSIFFSNFCFICVTTFYFVIICTVAGVEWILHPTNPTPIQLTQTHSFFVREHEPRAREEFRYLTSNTQASPLLTLNS